MGKSKESFNKKERENKKRKQQQQKREKKEQRKAEGGQSKGLDSMIAYLDENGNLSSTPPDPSLKKIFNAEDIQLGVPKQDASEPEPTLRQGTVSYFNQSKGFGFILDDVSGERIFAHVNNIGEKIMETDKVIFETERGHRGLAAINVKKKR
jgi:cold shock CspA family protein